MFSGFAASPEDMVEKIVRGPGREGKQTGLARKPKLDSWLKTLAIRLWLQKQQINSLLPERQVYLL